MTECIATEFDFHPLRRREVIGRFDGGAITSDAGGLLLRELEAKTGLLQRFSDGFTDHRVPELVTQRVFGLCLGYEDLNDHDELRHDPLLALLVGKADPTGNDRIRRRDKGKALAGKSTLNRLELTPPGADAGSRYKKIGAQIRVTFRKVWVALADCYPWRSLFAQVWANLRRLPHRPVPN